MQVSLGQIQLRFPQNATIYTRQVVAADMVERGRHFAASAMLLKQLGGHGYVWRHNLCQGVEILLKGLLLQQDFDRYWPRLRTFGHRLVTLCDETADAYGLRRPAGELRAEIAGLAGFYEQHQLRYAGAASVLISADSLACDRLVKRLAAVLQMHQRATRRVRDACTQSKPSAAQGQ